MSSRDHILNSVRANQPPEHALPPMAGEWISYADSVEQFCNLLKTIGSAGYVVDSPDQINAILADMPAYQEAERVCSLAPGVGKSTFDLNSLHRPHDLDQLDIAIVPGEIGVAENGAVWISDRDISHRAILYLAEHLLVVVSAANVVPHMHAAYERLQLPTFPGGGKAFGAWISGPSKTADIEQSLVIGAQGPRSSAVFLVR